MFKFIKRQKEIRLRKWCVELAIKEAAHGGYTMADAAQKIYDLVTVPRKSKP